MIRKIKKIFPTKEVMEGAGVRLQRAFSNPEVPQFDPFLLLDDFGSGNPDDYMAGFPWHPHRGIETVTYIVKGAVAHEDSIGNKGVINDGDVQWMTAGSGIIHQEMPQEYDGETKGFQLWVNLPKKQKMIAPRYRGITSKEIPEVKEDGTVVKVIAGKYSDIIGPVEDIVVNCMYFDVTLKAEKEFFYSISKQYTVFLYIFEGSVVIGNDQEVGKSIVALTDSGDRVVTRAGKDGARFLFVAGDPIGEPVAWAGPIVMNTQKEIAKAFEEFHAGSFIKSS